MNISIATNQEFSGNCRIFISSVSEARYRLLLIS